MPAEPLQRPFQRPFHPRRVFVSEYVTGGAWPGADVPDSLRSEGQAMAVAVAVDLAGVAGIRVVTTWDVRLGPSPFPVGVDVVPVGSADAERDQFRRLAAGCDAVLVIAPEFDGLLEGRCRTVAELGGRWLGGSAEAIALCADKLALAEHLGRHGLQVVPTRPAVPEAPPDGPWPLVLKPRDGAGSLGVRLLRDAAAWRAAWTESPESRRESRSGFVVQPFVPGVPLSVAAVIGGDGRIEVFPVARQRLSGDGRFTYLGGQVPAPEASRWQSAAEQLARAVVSAVAGLGGYVGFDLIGDEAVGRLWLVEVNPRLTTSYIGYRALARENLASRLLGRTEPVCWHNRAVWFTADGVVTSGS